MKYSNAVSLFAISLLTVALGGSAFGDPTNVTITPPNGARFLVGQKFDLRVQGRGATPDETYSAAIAIDGVPLEFTSGAQGTTTTDGISAAGYGGFNLRGYSSSSPGRHTVAASFSDSTGTVNASATFEIVNVSGRHRPVTSNRSGGIGALDLWVSTRETTLDAWSTPVNVGPTTNTTSNDGGPALSCDAKTMYFYSDRPGGFGGRDLYVSHRDRLHHPLHQGDDSQE